MERASIHAPARGATLPAGLDCLSGARFNPRSRTGSDGLDSISLAVPDPASIHAPARGATEAIRAVTEVQKCFNPRSRTGSDEDFKLSRGPKLSLQSTLPHGERRRPTLISSIALSFNPRSRTGSDTICNTPAMGMHTLQSTLPHGERPPWMRPAPRT